MIVNVTKIVYAFNVPSNSNINLVLNHGLVCGL